jgi:hypothetical protein
VRDLHVADAFTRSSLVFTREEHDETPCIDAREAFTAGGAMTTILWLIGALAVLWLVDRVLISCELRGWIYYRLSPRPRTSALANMLLGVEQIYRPSRQHVIERRMEEAVQHEEDDDGAGPGGDAGRDTIAAPAVPTSSKPDRPASKKRGAQGRSHGRRRGRRTK